MDNRSSAPFPGNRQLAAAGAILLALFLLLRMPLAPFLPDNLHSDGSIWHGKVQLAELEQPVTVALLPLSILSGTPEFRAELLSPRISLSGLVRASGDIFAAKDMDIRTQTSISGGGDIDIASKISSARFNIEGACLDISGDAVLSGIAPFLRAANLEDLPTPSTLSGRWKCVNGQLFLDIQEKMEFGTVSASIQVSHRGARPVTIRVESPAPVLISLLKDKGFWRDKKDWVWTSTDKQEKTKP